MKQLDRFVLILYFYNKIRFISIIKTGANVFIILVEGDNADDDPDHWRVIVGDHDRVTLGEPNETNHEIEKIITHEDYDYLDYDIGK